MRAPAPAAAVGAVLALALALAMAPGAAAKRTVYTIGDWTKTVVGEKPMPMDRPVRTRAPLGDVGGCRVDDRLDRWIDGSG